MSNLSRVITIILVFGILLLILVGIMSFKKSDSNVISQISQEGKVSVQYSSSELAGEYTNYSAKIDLNNLSIEEGSGVSISGTTITISKAGTYYFSGTANEGNIVVNADNQEVVIVLDNVTLTSSNTSVINVVDAKKVTVNIPEGTTSTLTDGAKYTVFTDDDEPNATIFSKDDLSIDGTGTLVINANYEDAIASKDGLKIVKTTIQISSADEGIRGKDYVAIKDANITINSKGKAIKTTEDTDTTLGYIVIDGGTFTINTEDDALHAKSNVIINDGTFTIEASDDGIHADSNVFINGGKVDIKKSYEGIEANYIEINGGETSVVATDDGININGGNDTMGMFRQDAFREIADDTSDNSTRLLVINGGTLYVEANGDGLDSNGSIKITGGNTIVGASTNGGNAALDYNRELQISGGTLIAYGPTGMWQNPSTSSTQYSIAFEVTGKNGDKVILKDASGNEVASFVAKRSYGIVCISTPTLKQGESYTLYVNDTEIASQEIISIVTSNSTSQGGFMGGGRGQMGNGGMNKAQINGEMPENMPSGDMQSFFNGRGGRREMNEKIQNNETLEMPPEMQNGEQPDFSGKVPNDGTEPPAFPDENGNALQKKMEKGGNKQQGKRNVNESTNTQSSI